VLPLAVEGEEVRYFIPSIMYLAYTSAVPAKAEKTAEASLTCETAAGKTVNMSGTVAGYV
jgi:hypothetical protein